MQNTGKILTKKGPLQHALKRVVVCILAHEAHNIGTAWTTAWLCAGIFPNSLNKCSKNPRRRWVRSAHAGSGHRHHHCPRPRSWEVEWAKTKMWVRWPSVTCSSGGKEGSRRAGIWNTGQPYPAQHRWLQCLSGWSKRGAGAISRKGQVPCGVSALPRETAM